MNTRTYSGRLVRTVLLVALTLSAAAAWPHTDDWFDTHPTPHGGQVRMIGPYHLELMVEPGALRIYVTDHADNGIATAAWTGQVIVLDAGRKTYYALKPAGDNLLQAVARLSDAPDVKLVVIVQPKAGEEYAARFAPGQRKAPAADATQSQPGAGS